MAKESHVVRLVMCDRRPPADLRHRGGFGHAELLRSRLVRRSQAPASNYGAEGIHGNDHGTRRPTSCGWRAGGASSGDLT